LYTVQGLEALGLVRLASICFLTNSAMYHMLSIINGLLMDSLRIYAVHSLFSAEVIRIELNFGISMIRIHL